MALIGLGVDENSRADDSRLFHDLFISGDDASEWLEDVRDVFGTDFTGFVTRYFPNETENGFHSIAAKLFGYKGRRWVPLPIAHLRVVIANGRWIEPDVS